MNSFSLIPGTCILAVLIFSGARGEAGQYCGSNWEDASAKCRTRCTTDIDSLGEPGKAKQTCFADVVACANKDSNYCGSSFRDSNKCKRPCPSGVDSDCLHGEKCFSDVSCVDVPAENSDATAPSKAPAGSDRSDAEEGKGGDRSDTEEGKGGDRSDTEEGKDGDGLSTLEIVGITGASMAALVGIFAFVIQWRDRASKRDGTTDPADAELQSF